MKLYEIPNISMQQIQMFLSVVDEGGFAKAGLAMHMSQPAISKSISKLEKVLDIQLFQRTTRQIHLTEAGQLMYDLWKVHIGQAVNLINSIHSNQTLAGNAINIAITNTTLAGKYLWEYVEKFAKEYPDVKVTVDSDSMHIITAKLLDGEYDIVIVPDFQIPTLEENNLCWKWVKKDSVKLLVHNTNPLSLMDEVSMEDILDETFVCLNPEVTPMYNQFLQSLFQEYDRKPILSTIYRSDSAVKSAYRGLDGMFITDDFFDYDTTAEVSKIPIEGHKNGVVCAYKSTARNSYVRKFVEMFNEEE